MLRTYLEVPIVLLFDDIFAELDEKKAEDMISELDCDQVILSSQRVLPQNEKWKNFSCINTENT